MVFTIPDTMHIGAIKVGGPTCADDTCIQSTTHAGAQAALLVAQNNANMPHFEFSDTNHSTQKSKHIQETMPLKLNGHILEYTKQEKHLDIDFIERHDDGKATSTIYTRIQIGRKVVYALMGASYYGLNGIGLMYALETLRLRKTNYRDLARFHQKMLRCIQHLPKATGLLALYLLTGSLLRRLYTTKIPSACLSTCLGETPQRPLKDNWL